MMERWNHRWNSVEWRGDKIQAQPSLVCYNRGVPNLICYTDTTSKGTRRKASYG